MSPDAFLGRALMDPATGLPNLPYFNIIRSWEEKRAERRGSAVREVRVLLRGGSERLRRMLTWRLYRALRGSDLVATHGPQQIRILLTSPDAEQAEHLCERIRDVVGEVNALQADDEATLSYSVDCEPAAPPPTPERCADVVDITLREGA